jgi:hypothetical protein
VELVKYFDSTWAGKLPIWCGSLVKAGSIAKSVKLHASNNSSEGIIKWYKSDPEFQLHRSDLGLYLDYAWHKHVESDRVFGLNVEGLQSAVDRYNNRANKFNCSQDAMEVELENREESRWGKARWDTEGPQLKNRLHQAFRWKGLNTRSDQMNALTIFAAADERKYGNHLLGANVFNVWMRDKRKAKKPIDEKSCVIMNAYVEFVQEEIESRNRLVGEGIEEMVED